MINEESETEKYYKLKSWYSKGRMNKRNARTEYNFKAMKSLLRHNIDSFWGGVLGEKSREISF